MPLSYTMIEVFSSQEARVEGQPLQDVIMKRVRELGSAGRCTVYTGSAALYENGEASAGRLEVLSHNMPLKIEIIIPSGSTENLVEQLASIVSDGIVSVRELNVVSHRADSRLIPRRMLVRDVMTGNPVTVTPEAEASDVLELLLNSPFNGVPVVDKKGFPLGIITQSDLIVRAGMPVRLGLLAEIESLQNGGAAGFVEKKTAGEVMSSPPICVDENIRLGSAVDIMLRSGLKRLPVTSSDGRVSGMLSRYDIIRSVNSESGSFKLLEGDGITAKPGCRVGDIMLKSQRTARPDTPVETVLRIMSEDAAQRVAVTDNNGHFLGLITDRSLIGVFSDRNSGIRRYFSKRGLQGSLSPDSALMGKRASDVMIKDAIVISPDETVETAVQTMASHSMKRIPVVDSVGFFRGMISRDDILRAALNN